MKNKFYKDWPKYTPPVEVPEEKCSSRASWALVILTIIVSGYFFVWAWTNF